MAGRGAVNGATALLVPGEARQTTVTTVEETLILNITREEMERVSKQIPEIRIGIIRHLMDLMFDSFKSLNELARYSGRLSYFDRYAEELGLHDRQHDYGFSLLKIDMHGEITFDK